VFGKPAWEAGRSQPAELQRWLSDNVPALIGQQILVASASPGLADRSYRSMTSWPMARTKGVPWRAGPRRDP